MKNFMAEFKKFAIRGNVVDLAVAVVIGTAFGKIVSSLVENIVTPLISVLLGGINFTNWSIKIGNVDLVYGIFIQSVFDFTVITLAVFVAIKIVARLKNDHEATVKPASVSEDIILLREIRDSLKK